MAATVDHRRIACAPWRSASGRLLAIAFLCLLFDECQYFSRQLVSGFWARTSSCKTRYPPLFKLCLRLIKCRPGKSKGFSCFFYRAAFLVDGSQHLILDLNKITRIKKIEHRI